MYRSSSGLSAVDGRRQWAVHVPLGKLYTERLVPVDGDVRKMISFAHADTARRTVSSSYPNPPACSCRDPATPCLRQQHSRSARGASRSQRAGCSHHVTCHQLRHDYATEMLRLGVSLPALMKLLGHKTIDMTMRYLLVTQPDLQREFHLARQTAAQHPPYSPPPPAPRCASLPPSSDLPGIRQSLAATGICWRCTAANSATEKNRREVQRLARRLLSVATELDRFGSAGNCGIIGRLCAEDLSVNSQVFERPCTENMLPIFPALPLSGQARKAIYQRYGRGSTRHSKNPRLRNRPEVPFRVRLAIAKDHTNGHVWHIWADALSAGSSESLRSIRLGAVRIGGRRAVLTGILRNRISNPSALRPAQDQLHPCAQPPDGGRECQLGSTQDRSMANF